MLWAKHNSKYKHKRILRSSVKEAEITPPVYSQWVDRLSNVGSNLDSCWRSTQTWRGTPPSQFPSVGMLNEVQIFELQFKNSNSICMQFGNSNFTNEVRIWKKNEFSIPTSVLPITILLHPSFPFLSLVIFHTPLITASRYKCNNNSLPQTNKLYCG